MAGTETAALLVARGNVAQQAGKNAAMDGAITGRARRDFIRRPVGGGDAVEDRRHFKILPCLQHIQQLRVDVAPLADTGVTQKVIAAKPPQPRLGEPFQLVVKRLPDGEQGKEIRIRMHETPMRGVGLFPRIHRAFTGILDRKPGRDDQHLVQRLFLPCLQNHPAHRGIDRQPGQLATERSERTRRRPSVRRRVFAVQRAQLLQQGVTGADRLHRRHVDEGKPFDVTQAEGLHAQDHVGQIGALDLGLGEAQTLVVILLRIQPDAYALGHATGPALALVAARLGDRLDGQTPGARRRHITAHPRQPRIDHEANARQGERGLGDIRRHDDFPAL